MGPPLLQALTPATLCLYWESRRGCGECQDWTCMRLGILEQKWQQLSPPWAGSAKVHFGGDLGGVSLPSIPILGAWHVRAQRLQFHLP